MDPNGAIKSFAETGVKSPSSRLMFFCFKSGWICGLVQEKEWLGRCERALSRRGTGFWHTGQSGPLVYLLSRLHFSTPENKSKIIKDNDYFSHCGPDNLDEPKSFSFQRLVLTHLLTCVPVSPC